MIADIVDALAAEIGQDKVLTDPDSLKARRFDQWVVNHLRDWRGQDLPQPGAVVRPASVTEVQAILRLANARGVAVIPHGLGSGVCGGVVASPTAILLDMSGFNAVRQIDETNLLASFDAGKNGLEAEEAVAAKGLTIGHWPQSIGISSVGGWVSTRASGQFSSAYGNIEDIIHSIEAVLPTGELVVLGKAARAAAGPDLRHLLMGAEGTMGVVTGVTLSLRRAAEHRAMTAFHAPTMAAGFEAQRQIYQADWRPPVMRLYDAVEARRSFKDHAREGEGLLLMIHEGPRGRVEVEVAGVTALAQAAGLAIAPAQATADWFERRNHVPAWRDLFERGFIVDTVEVSGSWTAIEAIYRDAVASLEAVEGMVNASAHSSHVYRSGINLYFSFAAKVDPSRMEATYFECWKRILEATAKHGGGIAHHHGSGRVRRDYLHHDLGEEGVKLLRKVKAALDPNGIMNPGNLLPDA
jgi:alkyldihydroxyacetonephosphate synthase